MDHGRETLIGLVAAHRDTFELLEFAKEVLDQVTPLVDVSIDLARAGASGMLGDHDRGAAIIKFGDQGVCVEGRVGDQTAEFDLLNQRRDADGIEAMARQQHEADQIAKRIGERQDLRRPAAFGPAYGLVLSPPFAPCP
jgi:hypothetical protein